MWEIRAVELALLLSLASLESLSLAFIPKSPTHLTRATYCNDKRLFYSSGLKSFLGSPEFNSTIPSDDAILGAYDNWRREYNKGDYKQDRFENFKVNYKTLMAANAASKRRARQGGKADPASIMSLNEHGDCSIEEYKNILNTLGQSQDDLMIAVEQPVTNGYHNDLNAQNTIDSLEAKQDDFEIFSMESKEDIILRAYVDWCKVRGNEFDESRLPIFTEHYLNAEIYFEQVGKPVQLNKYADLTAEEYNRLLSFEGDLSTTEGTKSPQPPLDSSVSAGSYLESIAKGKTTSTYFGEKKELKGQDLSDLYSSISNAEKAEEAKIQARRAEIAALEAWEAARLQLEEETRLKAAQEARQRALEEARLKAWEEARRKADEEAKQKAEEAMKLNQESREQGGASATPFRPLSGSYMGAVAKTWESRSEYLAKLQASNENWNKMSGLPDPDLSSVYDELDSITGSPPMPLTNDMGSNPNLPGVDSLGDAWWEDDIMKDDDIEMTNKVLAQVREAAKLLERRREDVATAQRAREEAEEWMRVQKKFEEQANLARERREREEKAIEEAQRRARELEAANLERERRQQEVQVIETQADERARAERVKQLRETEEQAVKDAQRKAEELEQESKPKSIFSMFQPKKASEEERAGSVATPVDEKSSVSPFSFLTGETKKNDQDGLSKKVPLSVDETTKTSPFSFFAGKTKNDEERAETMAAYDKNQRARQEKTAKAEQQRAKMLDEMAAQEPQSGFLPNWFQNEQTKQQQSTNIPLLSLWSQNEDGTISGMIDNSNNFNAGVRIITSPVLDRARAGTIVTTVSGSRYQLGEAGTRRGDGEMASEFLKKTFEFLGELPKKREVALLSDWQANVDGTITGIVQKKKGFNDGAKITTSPVAGEIRAGRVVKTRGGSFYRLL